jgi:hypothetical protein
MSEDTFIKNPYFLFILIIIVILGCIAGIIVPSIVIDNNSKLAPILIFSVILFVVLCYIILRNPYNLRQTLLPIIYIGALIGGIIIIAVSDIDESGKILGIIFLSLVFLISIVIGISYSGPNGEKFFSGIMYLILLITLIVSIVIIWTDVVDTGSVKVLTLICLSIILFLTLILGFISYKNKTFGKFNFLGLNPKIQIDRIKSWGISKAGAFSMFLILVVTVVMLYIGGAQFIDVYKNTTSKSDFDKNFALIWAILNFVVAAWITIQTLYFIVAIGMMYYESYKQDCYDLVKKNTATSEDGLPTGKLKELLDEYNLAYSSTDPTKSGYVDVITQPGAINENGIFIPGEFLEEDKITIKDDIAVRLALGAYLENHSKGIKTTGTVNIPSSQDINALIDFTTTQLRRGGVPNDIVIDLRTRLEEVGGQAVRYQTAEAAAAASRELASAATEAQLSAETRRRDEVARAEETRIAAIEEAEDAQREREEALRVARTAQQERDAALAAAVQGQRLAAEEGTRARRAIAQAESRAAAREGQASSEILNATRRTREADERVRRAEAAIARQRTTLETAIADEERIAGQAQAAFDRYNQSRDAIERDRAGLEVRILNARRATAIEEGVRCNQRILALRGELNTEINRLQGSIRGLEESLGTVRGEAAEATATTREAAAATATAREAAAAATRRADRILGEARANAVRAAEAAAAREEALRATAAAVEAREAAEAAAVTLAGREAELRFAATQAERAREAAQAQTQPLIESEAAARRDADVARLELDLANTTIQEEKEKLKKLGVSQIVFNPLKKQNIFERTNQYISDSFKANVDPDIIKETITDAFDYKIRKTPDPTLKSGLNSIKTTALRTVDEKVVARERAVGGGAGGT